MNTTAPMVMACTVMSNEAPNHKANARSLSPAEQCSRMRWLI
jgi:hypothetical protein